MSNRFFPNYDRYIITSPFGQRIHPVSRGKKMHNGIDLVATNDGTVGQVDKIMAHTGGVVDGVGYDSSAGNYVKIRVSLDTVMVYYHLRDRCSLAVGDVVKTGQIIGTMGATGNVTGKHLHFGIKENGKWIDPAPYLDKDYIKAVETVKIEMSVLKRGANGDQVKALQALLIGYGYSCGSSGIDGSFGSATDKAVRAYQKANGLAVDGSVGSKTWAKLLGV
jgi:hypothetical protein